MKKRIQGNEHRQRLVHLLHDFLYTCPSLGPSQIRSARIGTHYESCVSVVPVPARLTSHSHPPTNSSLLSLPVYNRPRDRSFFVVVITILFFTVIRSFIRSCFGKPHLSFYNSMSQFIQRLVNHLANEVLIKGLANSKTFQRFAVRTDSALKDLHKDGAQKFDHVVRTVVTEAKQPTNVASMGPPQPPLRGFPGFVSAFLKEIRSDLGMK